MPLTRGRGASERRASWRGWLRDQVVGLAVVGSCPWTLDRDPVSGRASRRKGKNGELEVVREFAKHGFALRRTPNSGGLAIKGDLIGLDGYHLEVKRQETLAIPRWLRQAHADAGANTPLLAFRCNRTLQSDPVGRWHVCLELAAFADLLRQRGVDEGAVPPG